MNTEREYEIGDEIETTVAFEYYHPEDDRYCVVITDFGDGCHPRYEGRVETGGCAADFSCHVGDDLEAMKTECMDLLNGFIELDLAEEEFNELEYRGYTLLVGDKLPIINIVNSEGWVKEAFFIENATTEELFEAGKEFLDEKLAQEK